MIDHSSAHTRTHTLTHRLVFVDCKLLIQQPIILFLIRTHTCAHTHARTHTHTGCVQVQSVLSNPAHPEHICNAAVSREGAEPLRHVIRFFQLWFKQMTIFHICLIKGAVCSFIEEIQDFNINEVIIETVN